MIIENNDTYSPPGATSAVTTTTTTTAIDSGSAQRVKRKFATATDVAGVTAGLRDMVDAMMNMEPAHTRANGKYVPPPDKRWKR